jgi:hypothetical protein
VKLSEIHEQLMLAGIDGANLIEPVQNDWHYSYKVTPDNCAPAQLDLVVHGDELRVSVLNTGGVKFHVAEFDTDIVAVATVAQFLWAMLSDDASEWINLINNTLTPGG